LGGLIVASFHCIGIFGGQNHEHTDFIIHYRFIVKTYLAFSLRSDAPVGPRRWIRILSGSQGNLPLGRFSDYGHRLPVIFGFNPVAYDRQAIESS
jgi:hypothetical protein